MPATALHVQGAPRQRGNRCWGPRQLGQCLDPLVSQRAGSPSRAPCHGMPIPSLQPLTSINSLTQSSSFLLQPQTPAVPQDYTSRHAAWGDFALQPPPLSVIYPVLVPSSKVSAGLCPPAPSSFPPPLSYSLALKRTRRSPSSLLGGSVFVTHKAGPSHPRTLQLRSSTPVCQCPLLLTWSPRQHRGRKMAWETAWHG